MEAKEEIRSRLAIEDVVGEYVELKRSGRSFKGLSPFTGERTPSFFVSPEKNIWHDFSSNRGGDIFAFIMEVEGVDFKGALELLARRANVDLSQYKDSKAQAVAARKKRLYAANEAAAHFFQHHMVRSKKALEYIFKTRGITKQAAVEYRIGYAPEGGQELVRYLSKKGFTKRELTDAGLTNRFGGDLFKDRMMVALMDQGGHVVGFTGRLLEDIPNAPKYLNTPATLLYDKSWQVFGLSQAKKAIRTHDYVVVVEGNLDVVSSWQTGVQQTVATAGTAMTLHHLKTLGRLTSSVRLAFDGDKAGVAATERAIPIAEQARVNLTIISLPNDAKDPDELIRRDPQLWQTAIDAAEPVLDWLLRQYRQRHDLSTAAGKRAYTTAGLQVVEALHDPVEQRHYMQMMADELAVPIAVLEQKRASMTVRHETKKTPPRRSDAPATPSVYAEEDKLLSLLYSNPAILAQLPTFASDIFHEEKRQAVAEYVQQRAKDPSLAGERLHQFEEYVTMLVFIQEEANHRNWSEHDQVRAAADSLRSIEKEHKKHRKEQLDTALRDAEETGDDERARQLLEEIVRLTKEINAQ